MRKKIQNLSMLFLVIFLVECANTAVKKNETTEKRSLERYKKNLNISKDENREDEILNTYNKDRKDKYSEFLVDIDKYTTKGALYQKKYNKHLIGIATDIIENKKMYIEKGTIGFYYEKKSGNRDRLYLGIDIDTKKKYSEKYGYVARYILRNSLAEVLETVHSCRSIFLEDKIYGMVIGFKWRGPRWSDVASIWITKEDVLGLENKTITFDELLQKSTITNTRGKIIVLQ